MEKLGILNLFRETPPSGDHDLVEKLEDFQKNINNGEGLTCIRDIINNIKDDNIPGVRTICSWERSTISEYPEVKKLLKDRFFSDEKDHPWKEHEEMEKNNKEKNEVIAQKLHHFIDKYIPKGWQENIGSVAHVPHFTSEEIKTLKSSNMGGTMNDYLKNFRQGTYKDKWYIHQAILDFFEKNNY